jgi:RimJ/RimL family protein N-acetyltransferase
VTELEGEGFRLRRAEPGDIDFLVSLATHEEVQPFLAAVSAHTRDDFRAELERAEQEPDYCGRFIIEVDGERAGAMAFSVANRRSRIANLYGLMIDPSFRGRGLADAAARVFSRHLIFNLGFHRLELECYGFNDRAIRHAERIYVREGVKRKAYWRNDGWVDGVLFGLIREDIEAEWGAGPT